MNSVSTMRSVGLLAILSAAAGSHTRPTYGGGHKSLEAKERDRELKAIERKRTEADRIAKSEAKRLRRKARYEKQLAASTTTRKV